MTKLLRLAIPAGLVALLAACSGQNATSVPSVGQSTQSIHQSQAIQPMSQQDVHVLPDGEVIHAHIMKPVGQYGPRPGLTGLLSYYSGPVQDKPSIYVVLWGFKTYGDPDNVAPYLQKFLTGLGGSKWQNILTQYYEQPGKKELKIKNLKKQLKGVWDDEVNAVPSNPSDAQVQAEAANLAAHFKNVGDASYVVATPTGHSSSGFGTQWCAYHGLGTGNLAYTNLPYMPDAGQNCGENFVNQGAQGVNDGVSIVEGHELAETQTDPSPPSGWYSFAQGEIGDICAWTPPWMVDITLKTGTFAVQGLYSDTQSSCEDSGP